MIDQGNWFAVHRKILDSEVFADPHMLRLWIWLLARASFKTKHIPLTTGRGTTTVSLEAGQVIVGRHTGAEALHWSPSTFRNRLLRLENMGMATIRKDTHWSVVSIVNWAAYQSSTAQERTGKGHPKRTGKQGGFGSANSEETASQPIAKRTTKGQASNTQRTQEKNDKKDKKKEGRKSGDSATTPSKEDFQLAQLILAGVKHVAPATKDPNIESWANDVRLMRDRDGRSHKRIGEVFRYANRERFWSTNILCPATLRKQFAKLDAQLRQATQGTSDDDAPSLPMMGARKK